jgi:hypothetical protein
MEPQKTPQNSSLPDGEQEPQKDIAQSTATPPTGQTTSPAAEDARQPFIPEAATNPLPVSTPKRQNKVLLFGLIIAAVLLLLSGGAVAAYYYVMNKPENVVKQALANTMDIKKVKTSHFSGALTFEATESNSTIGATYKGAVDNKIGAFDISGTLDVMVANITFDARSTDAKTFYARFGGLQGLPELLAAGGSEAAAYAPIIETLNNQWIEINDSLLKQYDKSYKSAVLTQADVQKITDAYLKDPFLVVKQVMANEVISGDNSYHYKMVVDSAKLKSFLTAVKDANLDSYKINKDTMDQYSKAIDSAKLSQYPFEVWIAKGNKMLKQVVFTFAAQGTSANLRFTVDSYNKPVKVEKPKGAKSLLDIISGIVGGDLRNITLGQGSGISL